MTSSGKQPMFGIYQNLSQISLLSTSSRMNEAGPQFTHLLYKDTISQDGQEDQIK